MFAHARFALKPKRNWDMRWLIFSLIVVFASCSSQDSIIGPVGKANVQDISYECLDLPDTCQDTAVVETSQPADFLFFSEKEWTGGQKVVRLDLETLLTVELPYPSRSGVDILAVSQKGSIYWVQGFGGSRSLIKFDFDTPDPETIFELDDSFFDIPWLDLSTETLLWIEDSEKQYKFCRMHVLSNEPDCFQSEGLTRGATILGSVGDHILYWSFRTTRPKRSITLAYFDFNSRETVLVETLDDFWAWPFEFLGFHRSSSYWQSPDFSILRSNEYLDDLEQIDDNMVAVQDNSFVFTDDGIYYVGGIPSTTPIRPTRSPFADFVLRRIDLVTGEGVNVFNFSERDDIELPLDFGPSNFFTDAGDQTVYWTAPEYPERGFRRPIGYSLWKVDIDTGESSKLLTRMSDTGPPSAHLLALVSGD